jgi:hypothetical protein
MSAAALEDASHVVLLLLRTWAAPGAEPCHGLKSLLHNLADFLHICQRGDCLKQHLLAEIHFAGAFWKFCSSNGTSTVIENADHPKLGR